MRRREPGHRSAYALRALIAIAITVALVGAAPVAVTTGTPAAGSETSLVAAHGSTRGTVSGLAPVVGSFADRAGYSPQYVTDFPSAVPAGGYRSVVVTFQPRSSAMFDPPAPGQPALSVAGVADRFGLAPGDYALAERYFTAHGFTIVHTWPDRLSLSLAAPVPAIDAAFGTRLLSAPSLGGPVTFPATPPSLPPFLEPEVAGVVGLSSGLEVFRTAPLATNLSSPSAAPGAGDANLVTPAIARYIYDLSGLYNLTGTPEFASSESIALLLWGEGYSPSDLTSFYAQSYPSSFPAVPIVADPVDGAPAPSASATSDTCGTSQELTLDLEWSGSMAPGAKLYAVYAPGSPAPTCSPTASAMSDALHTAIGLPVAAVSMSFSINESSDGSLRSTWDVYFAEAMQRGITLLAATGDLGGDGLPNCAGGPAPQYPATSPDVLAVGGTAVALQRSVLGQLQGFSETAWSGSGGGVSAQFAPPVWQQGLGYSGRAGPDVSASAAEDYLYYSGQPMVAAGTSFATPLWAGLVTEMTAQYGRTLTSLAPRLYAIGEGVGSGRIAPGLSDITSGGTCLGSARPGFDLETGWGTPRALLLFVELTKTFVDLSLSVSSRAVAPGGSLTIRIHLANASTGAPIAGVPVDLTFGTSATPGPCTGTFAAAAPSTDSFGNASLTATVPWCYLGSTATARAEVVAGGYYGTNSTSVAVNIFGWFPGLEGISDYPTNVVAFAVVFGAAAVGGYLIGRPRRSHLMPTPGPPAGTAPAAAPAAAVPGSAVSPTGANAVATGTAPGESPVPVDTSAPTQKT